MLVLGAVALGSVGLAQSAPFTLAEALTRIDRAPAVTQAQQRVRQAQADLGAARAQAGFRVDAGGKGAYSFAVPNAPDAASASLQLTASLPIGASSPQAIIARGAELNLETAEAQLRFARSDLARSVVRAYGRVLIADQQREQTNLLLELARGQARVLAAQQQVGAATDTQVLNAQLALNAAQQAQTQAEYALRDARLSLARLIGLSDLPGAPIRPAVSAVPVPDARLVAQSPGVIFARLQLERARLGATSADAQGLPALGVSLGYGGDRAAMSLGFSTKDFNATASLSALPLGIPNTPIGANISLSAMIPVWDGGGGDAARQSAAVALEAAQAQLEQTAQDVARQLEGAVQLAAVDASALGGLREAVSVNTQALEIVRQRLNAGSVTALDELAARVQLATSQGALLAGELRALEDIYQIYAVLGVGGLS